MMNRRKFLQFAAAGVALSAVDKTALAGIPEPVMMGNTDTQPLLMPNTGRPYQPVANAKWLEFALAHEQECQRVSFGG